MIQIRYDNPSKRDKLNEWYKGEIRQTLQEKQEDIVSPESGKVFQKLVAELRKLTEQDIETILLFPDVMPPPESGKRPFIDDIIDKFKDTYPCLRAYIRACNRAAARCDNEKTFQAEYPRLYQANEVIKKMFDYNSLGTKRLRELKERFGVPVCPYCNRQYIHTVEVGAKKPNLGDADHVLPKYIYQLFSLSLWNLAPSCMPCNRVFKGMKNGELLNPHLEGFDERCILEVRFHDVNALAGLDTSGTASNIDLQWTVQPEADDDSRRRMENNLSTFRLNEVYRFHREDVLVLLRKRYLTESDGYQTSLRRLHGVYLPDRSVLYGTSMNPLRFQEEPLSKMTYDVLEKN